ncbi:MAG TPA: penicillin acylase family protein [Longimicrobiales bacterium]|nr:penicillin acylase family protein [Longimicrobiales bacterium]
MRRLLLGLLALGLLIVLLGSAGVLYVRSALPRTDGSITLDGIDGRVEILRDDYGVPQIWAGSLEDAVFAQGYLHAQDRLWQMELVRRAIQGRLAEVLGEPALQADRFMRRLGLWRATASTLEDITAEERAIMRAYAAGVNAAVGSRGGALPPEFLALRHQPEPWTPRDILAVGKMMSFTLSSYSESVAVARAAARLGTDRARYLFPPFPAWGETILPAPPAPAEAPPLAAALVDAYSIAAASNAWVVSGALTRSGRPMLANDPHLGLQAPSLWYLVGIHAGGPRGLDVVGVSIPGAPLVILGHNRAIAWGMTNAYVDDADLFIERLHPADPSRYLTPTGYRSFEVVAESIAVKGWDEPDVLEVSRTRNGPVIPLDEAPDSLVLSARWTALGPGSVVRGILGLNRAADWPSFLQAVDDLDDPHQNVVYADTAGHIGYVTGGTIPVRGDRRPPPMAPVPGWTDEWEWRGTLAFDEHPRMLDPPRGYIVTANNRQTVEPIADLISGTWQEPFRAMRITEMLRMGGRHYDADDMRTMQMDVLDVFARRYRNRAVRAARDAGLHRAAIALDAWDLRAAPESEAATLFYTWVEILRRAAARDLYRGEPGYFPRPATGELLERRALPWREDGAAAYEEMARVAMVEGARMADGLPWRRANRAIHEHALGDVAVLDRLLGLDLGPTPHRGAPTTVNVAHYAFRSPAESFPFTTTSGPSMRHVVDMGNLDGAGGFVIGTGQSGLPFSRHYDDQRELWHRGGLLLLPLGRDAVEHRVTRTLILEPPRRE